jgi:dihydrofolate synthase / folylpolyglutamate synthase
LIDPAYLDALRAIARPIHAAELPRSLVPMRRLMAELGDPQKQFASIVVTGSVGKGTTCHQIAQLLWQSGRNEIHLVRPESAVIPNTGLYTGPHLHSFRERFVINGEQISQAEFVEVANTVLKAASHLDFPYSTFELATALALHWFAQRGVKIAVLEVGIGGRWDAVNVVENVVSVFTPIEREHVAMLGGSLQTIAWNKAGIIQPDGHAISVPQHPIVEDILRDEASLTGASLSFAEDERLARVACYSLITRGLIAQRELDDNIPALQLPGRLESAYFAGQRLLIDGGHTRASARRLLEKIADLTNRREVRLIVGMLRDKSAHDFLATFDLPRFHIVLITAPGHRAFSADELARQMNFQFTHIEVVPDLNTALAQVADAPENLIVITGSLRLAAAAREAFGLLSPDERAEAQATRAIFDGEDYLAKLRHFR